MALRRSVAVLFLFALLPASSAWANVAPAPAREEVQKKLEAFFAHLDDKSPAGLNKIAKSPKTLEEIDKRIASMSDAEVADFQKMMKEVPDWQTAPQSIAKMLSPEAMKTIQKTGAEFTKNAPQAEKMRSDIGTLATVLKMLPDAKLKELGIDRSMIDSLNVAVGQIDPLQAGILQRQLASNPAWPANASAALNALPPALQRGAEALAKHGPITAVEVVELEKYRASLVDVLDRVADLPEETRKQLKVEDLRADVAQFRKATPDVVFMLREQLPQEQLSALSVKVSILEQAAKLTPAERDQLEQFRREFADTFARMQPDHPNEGLQKAVASLSTADLLVLKNGMPDFPAWQDTLPALTQAIQGEGFAQRLAAVKQTKPDPAAVASLEGFRQEALGYIDAVSSDASVTPELAASARKAMQDAKLPALELFRSVTAKMPESASAASRLRMVTNLAHVSFDCAFTIHTPDPLPNIDINLNFICDPIAGAINTVIDGISTAINAASAALTTVINDVKSALQTAIDAVTNTVNSIVNGLVQTATDIFNFVKTIPDLAWNAIKNAFNLLLDINLGGGLTLRTLISGGLKQVVPALQNALSLGEGFWNSLNDSLPLIPCPPDGFSTPFGTVGTGDAVTKYNRYAFFLDKIFGLIPSDVFSLEVKIPAQVLYAAWQYLGVCLTDAAAARDSAQTDKRWADLTTSITNLGNQSGNNTMTLIAAISGSFASLTTLTTNDDAALTTLINNKSSDLKTNDNQKFEDARLLNLRLAIELDLQAGDPGALAMFQLPQANGGYLEMVQKIVNDDINGVLASGQSAGQAQKFFADALAAISAGKFKLAFKNFQKAYNELTKQ